MPKIQRKNLPEGILRHLLRRCKEREIVKADLEQLIRWLKRNPTVPDGDWYKRFPNFTLCGEGQLVKTILRSEQVTLGIEAE